MKIHKSETSLNDPDPKKQNSLGHWDIGFWDLFRNSKFGFRISRRRSLRGQMTVEYTVMFVAIVAVIIYASTAFIQPSMNKFFNGTSKIINKSVDEMENRFG